MSQVACATLQVRENATREDSQTMQLTVHVTQAILDEARQRGLTGEEMLELAIQRAL
jgi:hypothetical protein